jgi:RimJ/RimL family protein N-acetyltransferase
MVAWPGGFNLNAITRGLELKADITWWVAAPLCGRGLATEGVAALLAHALEDLPRGLGLHQVQAWISRDNEASIRLAQRVGLRRQGDTQSYLQTGGAVVGARDVRAARVGQRAGPGRDIRVMRVRAWDWAVGSRPGPEPSAGRERSACSPFQGAG